MALRGGSGPIGALFARLGGLPATFLLTCSIVLEIIATTSMKFAANGSRLWYIGVWLGYLMCFTIFPMALRTIPLSLAYATWSGAGTAASVVLGAILFAEKITPIKLLWITMIVVGVVGLNI